MSFLDSDLSSVDLRSTVAGVVRRWWVVAASVVVAIGIVFAQDSGLQTEPNGNVIVERTYEATVETDELSIVKIDPAAITPVPSFDNQLAILRSDATLDELRASSGSDGAIEVTRSEPKFTIVETIDDLNNKVSFLSTGTPSYTYRCIGSKSSSCGSLIDAYVARTTELRKESVLGGLEDGISLTNSLIESGQERIVAESLDPSALAAQQAEISSLITKRNALERAASKVTGSLILVSEGSWTEGKSTASVSASTYGFGLGVGLIVGILIALQLAALDKKIRHAWQIRRVDDSLAVIGSPYPRHDDAQCRAVSAALRHAQLDGAGSALIVAEGSSLADFARRVSNEVPDLSVTIVESNASTTVGQLAASTDQVALVLVAAGHTTRRQLAESIGLVTAGGNRLLGVALVD